MKPLQILAVFIFSMLLSVSGFSADTVTSLKTEIPAESSAVRMTELETRLDEIKAMDIKSMSRAEKKSLRKEVKAIEKEMKTMNNGGVYISVGGIIIIILLLILLL